MLASAAHARQRIALDCLWLRYTANDRFPVVTTLSTTMVGKRRQHFEIVADWGVGA
jgi:hypothetical protein